MSIAAINHVLQHSRARHGSRLVLIAIADCSDEDGIAWPSVPYIARVALLEERQVRRCIAELVEANELVILRKGRGRGVPTRYQIITADILSAVATADICDTEPRTSARKGGHMSRKSGHPTSDDPYDPSVDPSTDPSLPSATKPKARKPKPVNEEFIASMVAEWSVRLGGEQAIRDEINDALNHTASKKAIDKRRYIQTWLRRADEFKRSPRNGHAANGGAVNGKPPSPRTWDWDAIAAEERMRKEAAMRLAELDEEMESLV